MRMLIVYGTTEGHTRDLAEFVARCLRNQGYHAHAVEAGKQRVGGDRFDAVIVAASLHVGHFQPAVVEFVRASRDLLCRKPAAFISVSLSAAGENPADWQGLEECVARFEHETLWTPTAVHHAAGAIRYSRYDFFRRMLIQHIARKHGKPSVTSRDYDLTDYHALKSFVLDFARKAERVHPSAQPAAACPPQGGIPA